MSQQSCQPPRPGQQLTVTGRRVDDIVVVTATGEVDIATGPDLQAALVSAAHETEAATVVVDINAVTFLGSRGLAALLRGLEEAKRQGKNFRVALRNHSPVYRVLEVTGVHKELSRYETVDEALGLD